MPFVATSQRVYETGEGTAGFLKLPEGAFRADPNASLTQTSSGQYFVGNSPALPGAFFTPSRAWDAKASRWLPVQAQQVAPDGASYIYQVGPDLHLVIVETGADTVIYHQPSSVPPANWAGPQLHAYFGGAAYVSVNSAYGEEGGSVLSVPADQVGVWRIDVASGAPTRILTVAVDGLITGGASKLWAIQDDAASPPTGALVQYDLQTAQASRWFAESGSGMDLLGFDPGGNPIVWTFDYHGGLKIWLVRAPNTGVAIDSETYTGYVPYYAGNNFEFGSLVVDQRGVWIGSVNGLLLYDKTGLHQVASNAGIPLGSCV